MFSSLIQFFLSITHWNQNINLTSEAQTKNSIHQMLVMGAADDKSDVYISEAWTSVWCDSVVLLNNAEMVGFLNRIKKIHVGEWSNLFKPSLIYRQCLYSQKGLIKFMRGASCATHQGLICDWGTRCFWSCTIHWGGKHFLSEYKE